METDGTNHFLESCSAMADECPGTGLKCMQEQATCSNAGVAWHSKVKQHAVSHSSGVNSWGDEETAKADPALTEAGPAGRIPTKYVLHTKYKAVVRALKSDGHRVFAQGIIISLVVLGMTVALATNSNVQIASNTWSVIDYVVVTFLAFSWFVIAIDMLDYFNLSGFAKVCTHLALSVLLILASLLISWRLRSNDESVDIFNSIFPMLVMWCNAGFVETAQKHWMGSTLFYKVDVLVVLIVLTIWYTLLTLFVHFVFERFATAKGWAQEQENLITGGALACGFVLWCHMVISGSYHSLEGLHQNCPSMTAVIIQILLGFCFLAVSMLLIPIINRKCQNFESCNIGSNGFWKLQILGVTSWFLKFLPCFSLTQSLGLLLLCNMGYLHGSTGARLLLLLTSIAIAILVIAVGAFVPFLRRDNDSSKHLSGLLLGLGGFMVGTAWSGLLDNSINMMAKGRGYQDGFHVKLCITGFLTAFIFPVYCYFLKPLIMRKAE